MDTLGDLGIAQSLPSPACQGLRSWRVRSSSQRDQKGRLRRARSWSGAPDGSPLLPQALAFVAFICLEVLSLSMSLPSSLSSLGAESHLPSRPGPLGPPSKSLISPCSHRGHPPPAMLCVLPRPPSSSRSASSRISGDQSCDFRASWPVLPQVSQEPETGHSSPGDNSSG